TEEVILHDNSVRTELPKQKPDRVYGLRATTSFEKYLSSPFEHEGAPEANCTLGDLLGTSPFKSGSDPLLFPFLLLEAKSEQSGNGFDDIQVQSAFPLWALLTLQQKLQSFNSENDRSFHPLVWFLATRGDTW